MGDRLDVAVIGAGLGGLVTACLLANRGYSVHVFEQSERPGGLQTSFSMADCQVDSIAAFIDEVDSLDFCDVLDELALQNRVEFVRLTPFGRLVGPGYSVSLADGPDRMLEDMDRCFPGTGAEVRTFLSRCQYFLDSFMAMRGGVLDAQGRTELDYFLYRPYTDSVVASFTSPALRSLFINQPFFMISGERSINGAFPMGRLIQTLRKKMYSVRGGLHRLPEVLATRLQELGGAIHFRTPVQRILLEHGRASGVVAGGESVAARAVISGIDARTTFLKLMDPNGLPDWLARGLAGAWVLEESAFIVHLVLRGKGNLPPYLSYSEQRGYDRYEPYDGAQLFSPSYYDPTLCPSDREIMIIQTLDGISNWAGLGRTQYEAERERVTQALIDLAERASPGVRDRIVALQVATPVTLQHDTGNTNGAYMGWCFNPRNTAEVNLVATPVPDLYLCGHWAGALGCAQGVFHHATLAARLAGRRISRYPREGRSRP